MFLCVFVCFVVSLGVFLCVCLCVSLFLCVVCLYFEWCGEFLEHLSSMFEAFMGSPKNRKIVCV